MNTAVDKDVTSLEAANESKCGLDTDSLASVKPGPEQPAFQQSKLMQDEEDRDASAAGAADDTDLERLEILGSALAHQGSQVRADDDAIVDGEGYEISPARNARAER